MEQNATSSQEPSWKPLFQFRSETFAVWFTSDSVCPCFTHKVWRKVKITIKKRKERDMKYRGRKTSHKTWLKYYDMYALVHICTKTFSWASGTGLLYQWTLVLRLHEHISCLFLESAAPNTDPCTKWNKRAITQLKITFFQLKLWRLVSWFGGTDAAVNVADIY